MENYEHFIADFKDDAITLLEPADFSDKEKELEKIKKQELIKCEKQIKKDINEWEELFAGNASLSKSSKGLQTLGDKILKIMDSSIKKQLKKATQNNSQFVVIIGEEEVKNYEVVVKDFDNSKEQKVKQDLLIHYLSGKI
jgi:threonyl-tRNA synthetase